ncbi:MAG: hypothetical protein HY823_05225 [Acidobacteria bacterium]|nr:hypothetical protein [Acidobacteriota bacterium]
MSDADQKPTPSPPAPPGLPPWIGRAIVALLALQLGLGYVQGMLLHRQQSELQAIRGDLQDLADLVEQGQGGTWESSGSRDGWAPASRREEAPRSARAVLESEEDGRARKEVQDAQKDARKAVQDARKAQEQLSLEENAKKAQQKAKIEEAQSQWLTWSLAAVAAVALALGLRGWWRRRG